MSVAGLQVFDANGKCILDVTTRLTMLYGVVRGRIGWKNVEIVIQDKKIKEGETWVLPVQASNNYANSLYNFTFAKNITTPLDIIVGDGYIKVKKAIRDARAQSVDVAVFYGGF